MNASLTIHQTSPSLSMSLSGTLDLHTTPDILRRLEGLGRSRSGEIRVDLGQVERMDDCGALVIVHLQNMATTRNCALHLDNMPGHVRDLLKFLRLDTEQPAPAPRRPGAELLT